MKSINYIEKDYETIFSEMIRSAYHKKLLSEDEYFIEHINNLEDIENNYVMLESVYAWEINQIYKSMTQIYESNDIDKAVGNDLDVIGSKLGMSRPSAQKSQVALVFTKKSPSSTAITIPKGTLVSDKDGLYYVTIETKILYPDISSVTVQAECTIAGYEGRVGKNTLNYVVSGVNNVIVNNPRSSGGGRDAYSDNEYRELLKAWAYSHIKGTKEAYEWYFANRNGVDGYKLIPLWDGTGTVKCIIDPANEYLEEQISKELLQNVQLFDDDVYVVGARNVTVDIDCAVNVNIDETIEYSLPELEELELRVEDAIHTYIDGGYYTTRWGDERYYKGMQIGQDFIPHKCAVFIDSQVPEVKTIEFNGVSKAKPLTIKGEDFTNYNKVAYELNMERIVGDRGGSATFNRLINMINPYYFESDGKDFSFSFYDKNNKLIKTFEEPNFLLDKYSFEDARLEVNARDNGVTLSYIKITPLDKVGDISGSYITVDDDEVCVAGNVNIKIS